MTIALTLPDVPYDLAQAFMLAVRPMTNRLTLREATADEVRIYSNDREGRKRWTIWDDTPEYDGYDEAPERTDHNDRVHSYWRMFYEGYSARAGCIGCNGCRNCEDCSGCDGSAGEAGSSVTGPTTAQP